MSDETQDPQEAAREWATRRRDERRLTREVEMTASALSRVVWIRRVAAVASLCALAGLASGGGLWLWGARFSERADALTVVLFLVLMVAAVGWVFLGFEQTNARYRALRAQEDLEFHRDVLSFPEGGYEVDAP